MNTTRLRLGAILVAFALATACGDDDPADVATDSNTEAQLETSSPATDAAPSPDPETTAEPTEDTGAADAGAGAEPTEESEEAAAAAFPVTIEHKFGETTIEGEPERVVSVGFAEHDGILALGVTPVGVRDWYGEQPYATWPWAQDELGDAEPEVIAAAALNFEQIASLEPDVILGISSGMTDSDYATLSAIAPTVAQPAAYPDYGTPWREQLEITGQALGRSEEAAQVLADVEQLFAHAREQNPDFEGQTAAVAYAFEDQPGAYASSDIRSQMMIDLGFVIPPEFDELAGDSFYFTVSQEELPTLDTDVIVWLVSSEADYEALRAMPLRPTLTAYAEGRELVADPLLSGAFSHSSPLSLEYVIEELVPELALAVDGDPSTAVPSTRLLDPASAEQGDLGPEQQAAAEAWAIVFDSAVSYEEKAPYLEDAEALQATIESYTTAGDAMGGITLEPTNVIIDGGTATIIYDVLFGGNAAYTALEGEMSLVDGTWTVSRDEFCTFMASARNACPS